VSKIRKVEYFYATIAGGLSAAGHFLDRIAAGGVSLLAFHAIPMGPTHTQLVLFPDDPAGLRALADEEGLALAGPQTAVLVQGKDRMGFIAEIHHRLADAGVEITAGTGVVGGEGRFGYVVYVEQEQVGAALDALEATGTARR